MLTTGLFAWLGTAAACGASYGAVCVLAYFGATRMGVEGATGVDILGFPIQEGAMVAGASPSDATAISDSATLMFDIGSIAVGGVGILKQPLFMFNTPGVIGPMPARVPLIQESVIIGTSAVDVVHDAMVVEGITQ